MSCKMRDLSHIKRVCRNFPSCLHSDQTCLFCKLSLEKHCGLWDKRTDRDNLIHTDTHISADTQILSNSLDDTFFLKYYCVVRVDSCTNLTCLFFLMEHFSALYFQISWRCVCSSVCVNLTLKAFKVALLYIDPNFLPVFDDALKWRV